jgi:hypothetical protein
VKTLDEDAEDVPLWVHIPEGFFELPLADVENRLAVAESILGDVADEKQKREIHAVIGVLSVLLSDLATVGGLYCGIGRHISPVDGSVVTSSLVISCQEFEGTRNPRLVLKDLVGAKADAGERGQADLVDLHERPTLFFEHTKLLPTPQLPGGTQVDDDAVSRVFQLEAFVPSADGSKLAIAGFSTPFEDQGPLFRAILVQLAGSVLFEPPELSPEVSGRIGEVLG